MGCYLSKPITEKKSNDETSDKLICGYSSMQGWRVDQEDAHNCLLDFDTNSSFFAVYDGHGGAEVAQYCALNLPQFIKDTPAYKEGDIPEALIQGFLGFDSKIVALESEEVWKQLRKDPNFGKSWGAGDSSSQEESDDEDNVESLKKEASMPIDQLMKKYTSKCDDVDMDEVTAVSSTDVAQQSSASETVLGDGVSSSSEAKASDESKYSNDQPSTSSQPSSSTPSKSQKPEEPSSSPKAKGGAATTTKSPIKSSTKTADAEENNSALSSTSSVPADSSEIIKEATPSGASTSSDDSTKKQKKDEDSVIEAEPQEEKSKKVTQNGDISAETSESADAKNDVTSTDAASSSPSGTKVVNNGDVSPNKNKGKGKAVVPPVSPQKSEGTRRSIRQQAWNAHKLFSELFTSIKKKDKGGDKKEDAEEDEEEEESDEEDQTFEGSIEDSSEDEEEGVNVAIECEDDEEEDGGAEDEEETSEYDNDEDDDDEDDEVTDLASALSGYRDGESNKEPWCGSVGCTAVVALLKGNELYVANAGDSRCVVCRNGEAIEMSFDHKPENEPERERIYKAGGRIDDGRVDGGLNLSRAIGDHRYKRNKELSDREQMITALPDIKTLTVNPRTDEFMVLACDGIWNSMTSQEVVDFVKKRLDEDGGCDRLSKICEEMFDYCLAPNVDGDGTGCDNMTAIIVKFKTNILKRPPSPSSSAEQERQAKTEKKSETTTTTAPDDDNNADASSAATPTEQPSKAVETPV